MLSTSSSTAAAIPVFSLYGESGLGVEAITQLEFVHVETIEARSRRYDWIIGSHAHHGLFQLLFLFAGGAQATIDGTPFALRPSTVVVIPPGVVHAFRFEPGTDGTVLTFAESLVARTTPSTGTESDAAWLFQSLAVAPSVFSLVAEDGLVGRIAALINLIDEELRWPHGGRDAMLEWLVHAVLLLVARELSAASLNAGARGRADLFARFRRLVEARFIEHLQVRDYAQALNVTESRLDRLCRTLAGKSAFDVVQDRLLLEARRKLTYVAASVSQIAYELGFSDPAYFCRFFKKHAGMAPSAFRRQRADG